MSTKSKTASKSKTTEVSKTSQVSEETKKVTKKAAKEETPKPVVETTETKESKPRKQKATKAPKEETKTEVSSSETTTETSTDAPSEPKTKKVVSKESLEKDYDDFLTTVSSELEVVKSSGNKYKATRFLKQVIKTMKGLKADSLKLCKKKSRSGSGVKRENLTSGFMKPVSVSSEMTKFAGWSSDELKSRVDVTKFICEYISKNNLQNPQDKRQILPDEKLSKLLSYDKNNSKDPLTYYGLQKLIQPHFNKPVAK